jgi:hypothetical protein
MVYPPQWIDLLQRTAILGLNDSKGLNGAYVFKPFAQVADSTSIDL